MNCFFDLVASIDKKQRLQTEYETIWCCIVRLQEVIYEMGDGDE